MQPQLEKISQEDLNEIVRKHGVFLKGVRGGARAVVKFKDLSNLDFRGVDLSQGDFTGSLLIGANMANGQFRSVTFFTCDLRNANFENADLGRADFRGSYMAGVNLAGANLEGADLREGKIMERGEDGALAEKTRPGIAGKTHRTVLTGAKLKDANMANARATRADFSDADLSQVNIKDAELEEADFGGANLSNADMSGATLTNANMNASVIAGAVMEHAETSGVNLDEALTEQAMGTSFDTLHKTLEELLEQHSLWVGTAGLHGQRLDLSGYDLRGVPDLKSYSLTAVKANGAAFLNQDMEGMEIQSAFLDRADLRDCRLSGADLRGTSFKNALLSRADLSGANLSPLHFTNEDGVPWIRRVNLSGANLRYALLRGANLSDADLSGVDFSYASLSGCDLRRANLNGAVFANADLTGAHLDGADTAGTGLHD